MKAPRTLDRLNDWLNPIVVKELRQAVQSKFIIAVLLLFLVLQLGVLGLIVGLTNPGAGLDGLERWSGRETFLVLHGILLGTCMLLIPAYTGIRLAFERSDMNVDLLFITTLPPRAILTGKFLAAMVLVVLIFSAFTPFLFFTYLLRGIDLPSIVAVLILDLLAVIGALQLAIFMAVIPTNRIFRVLLGLVAAGFLVLNFVNMLATNVRWLLIGKGVWGVVESPDFWSAASCVLIVWVGVVGLFFTWSLALLSPPPANRAFLPRLFLAALWLGSAVVFGAWGMVIDPMDFDAPPYGWCSLMALLFGLQMVIAINEREEWTPRLARTIPRSRWLRLPAFLFYSGAAGGLLFGVLGFGLTLLSVRPLAAVVEWLREEEVRHDSQSGQVMEVMLTFGLYVLAYALTAVFVRRVLPIRIQAVYTWVVMIALLVLGCAIPGMIWFFMYQRWSYESHYPWLWTNPFLVIHEVADNRWRHGPSFLTFAGVWAGVVTLLNVPWFWRQVRRFRPYQGTSAASAKAESSFTITAAPGTATRTYGK